MFPSSSRAAPPPSPPPLKLHEDLEQFDVVTFRMHWDQGEDPNRKNEAGKSALSLFPSSFLNGLLCRSCLEQAASMFESLLSKSLCSDFPLTVEHSATEAGPPKKTAGLWDALGAGELGRKYKNLQHSHAVEDKMRDIVRNLKSLLMIMRLLKADKRVSFKPRKQAYLKSLSVPYMYLAVCRSVLEEKPFVEVDTYQGTDTVERSQHSILDLRERFTEILEEEDEEPSQYEKHVNFLVQLAPILVEFIECFGWSRMGPSSLVAQHLMHFAFVSDSSKLFKYATLKPGVLNLKERTANWDELLFALASQAGEFSEFYFPLATALAKSKLRAASAGLSSDLDPHAISKRTIAGSMYTFGPVCASVAQRVALKVGGITLEQLAGGGREHREKALNLMQARHEAQRKKNVILQSLMERKK